MKKEDVMQRKNISQKYSALIVLVSVPVTTLLSAKIFNTARSSLKAE